jgi:two-component sensor histidine kinase
MARRILDREDDLKQSIIEKDDILREVHHRVKNNLQIIISLLNMGKRQVKDPFYTQALDDTRNRITAISQVHKTLHESEQMLSVDLIPFMTELTTRLSKALDFKARNIQIVSHVDAQAVNADTATPIALFMVEALTNAAKHGLSNGGTISTTLIEANGTITLTVQDNGIGAKAAAERDAITPELSTSTGTGQKLMRGFARQLGGRYKTESSPQGYMCQLTFPRRSPDL